MGNNVVGADCVEFKPVENPKVFVEAGSPAPLGAREEVTSLKKEDAQGMKRKICYE